SARQQLLAPRPPGHRKAIPGGNTDITDRLSGGWPDARRRLYVLRALVGARLTGGSAVRQPGDLLATAQRRADLDRGAAPAIERRRTAAMAHGPLLFGCEAPERNARDLSRHQRPRAAVPAAAGR